MAATVAAVLPASALELGRHATASVDLSPSAKPGHLSAASSKLRRPAISASRGARRKQNQPGGENATGIATAEVMKQEADKVAAALDRNGLAEAVKLVDRAMLCPFFVAAVVKRTRRAEAAMQFFSWAQQQEGYNHDVYTYNSMLASLAIDKRSLSMEELFQQMESDGIEPDSDSYDLLVKGLCRSGELDEAWNVLRRLISRGYPADPLTCGSLVERFCATRRVAEACRVFQELEESQNVYVGMLAYNAILRALLSSGDVDGGFELSSKLIDSGALPRVLAYKTTLDCLIRTGRTREASELVAHMVRRSGGEAAATLTALVSVLCKHNLVDDAMRVVELMKEQEVLPGSGEVYAALVAAHCRTRRLDAAYALFLEMLGRGYGTSPGTYGHLLTCLCQGGKFDLAYDLHRGMRASGHVESDDTYALMVAAAFASGQPTRGRELFQESGSSSAVANAVVEGLCRASKVGEALEFTATMVEGGWVPTLATYNALIMGLFKANEHYRATELFGALRQKGVEPDAKAYSTIVDGLCKAGRTEEAYGFFVDAVQRGSVPDNPAYNALVKALLAAGRQDEAGLLLLDMVDRGYVPDNSVRNLLSSQV